MARYVDSRKRWHIMPWVMVALWICVIWGHSLMPGSDSGAESQLVVDFVRTTAYGLYRSDIAWVKALIANHPRILSILYDTDMLHYYVRKGAHFSEYLVLAMLVFNAVRLNFSSVLGGLLVILCFWAGTPLIDETIQRYVPERAGQMSDVMIDMGGFATGLALCLVIALPIVLIKGIMGLLLGENDYDYEYDEASF